VLVSTIRFPQFWKRVCNRLAELEEAGEISDSFRLLFDLQGYSQSDISDAFVFDHAVPFHLTEQNAEELEGFEDIWSTILDERVLLKLEDKVEAMRALIVQEAQPKPPADENEEGESEAGESDSERERKRREAVEPESPTNFKLIDGTIRSPAQRSLYK
jgi:hypothetical protein